MNDAHVVKEAGKNGQVQIDGESWVELTFLLDRVVDTLGVIAPVLELAKKRNAEERTRHLRAVMVLAFRGQRALKAFAQRWALVAEENLKRPATEEDLQDIFQAAQRLPSEAPRRTWIK